MTLQINTSCTGMPAAARTTLPSRSLFDQRKPLRYVPAVNTDVARTFDKYRRLSAIAKGGAR